jgi:hypothetical protein
MISCDSCGVQWIHPLGVDIKDHWYILKGIRLCEECYEKQNEDDFEKSLKESDWGHQPS